LALRRPDCARLNLAEIPTLQELLMRVRDFTLDALSHSDLPFEVLLDKNPPLAVTAPKSIVSILLFLSDSIFAASQKSAILQFHHTKRLASARLLSFSWDSLNAKRGSRAIGVQPGLFDATTIKEDSGILRNDSGRNAR